MSTKQEIVIPTCFTDNEISSMLRDISPNYVREKKLKDAEVNKAELNLQHDLIEHQEDEKESSREDADPLAYQSWFDRLPLCFGLLMRLRSGLLRVYRRSQNRIVRDFSIIHIQFFDLVNYITFEKEFLNTHWSREDDRLWKIAEELIMKGINLSLKLQSSYRIHLLYPVNDSTEGLITFHKTFLDAVAEYHKTIQRPEGTFALDENDVLMKQLCAIERVKCPTCLGNRQLYCGPCHGQRMNNADHLLPPPVELPFDILLLLHW